MRRLIMLLSVPFLTVAAALLLPPDLVVTPQTAAFAQTDATPTPYPIPTKAIPLDFPTEIVAPDGRTVEIFAVEPPDADGWRKQLYGKLLGETDHFLIRASEGYFPVDLEQFARAAEEVYDYVSARLKVTGDEKAIVLFERPDTSSCPVRGLAVAPDPNDPYAGDDQPMIVIYADGNTGYAQIMGAFAHELGHVLTSRNTEQRWLPWEIAYIEGLATWAAGRYYNNWLESLSFDDSVRSYLEQSKYLPLYEHYDLEPAYSGENCIESRDILYTEWASFIDFLLNKYGYEQFETLLHSPKSEEVETDDGQVVYITPADYQGVYGLELNQLEAQWLDHLMAESKAEVTTPRRECPLCSGR